MIEVDFIAYKKLEQEGRLNDLTVYGGTFNCHHLGHRGTTKALMTQYPGAFFVMMPCKSNPNPKIIKGRQVHPSTASVRYDILRDDYENMDRVIVSDYEITKDGPSYTYLSIMYLIHVDYEQFIAGHPSPTIHETPQNRVTWIIGADNLYTFDTWKNWKLIMQYAHLIVIDRPGYPLTKDEGGRVIEFQNAVDTTKVEFQQEVDARMNTTGEIGTITHLDMGYYPMSSTEIRAMWLAQASKEKLLQYITLSTFNTIEKRWFIDASSDYYSPQIAEIKNIVMRLGSLQLHTFIEERKRGLRAYIPDLQDCGRIEGTGFTIDNGAITINLELANHEEFNHVYERLMFNRELRPWFELADFRANKSAPHNYNARFKLLGNNGENKAVDLVVLIQNEADVHVLTIQRNSPKRELALPGGMNPSVVWMTGINELIEECFSNKLFMEGSRTSHAIDKKYADTIQGFKHIMQSILNTSLENNVLSQMHFDQVCAALNEHVYQQPSSIIYCLLNHISNLSIDPNGFNAEKRSQLRTYFSCHLYKTLLPEKFAVFEAFIKNQGKESYSRPNETDPRNTDLAWVKTEMIRVSLTQANFDFLCMEACLELSGGDDAFSAQIIPLDAFCLHPNVYSDHRSIVLEAVTYAVYRNELFLTPQLLEQIAHIERGVLEQQRIVEQQINSNHLFCADSNNNSTCPIPTLTFTH